MHGCANAATAAAPTLRRCAAARCDTAAAAAVAAAATAAARLCRWPLHCCANALLKMPLPLCHCANAAATATLAPLPLLPPLRRCRSIYSRKNSCSKIMIFGREIICVCEMFCFVMTDEIRQKNKKHILFLLRREFTFASKNNKI
jgi:hypothetical protein